MPLNPCVLTEFVELSAIGLTGTLRGSSHQFLRIACCDPFLVGRLHRGQHPAVGGGDNRGIDGVGIGIQLDADKGQVAADALAHEGVVLTDTGSEHEQIQAANDCDQCANLPHDTAHVERQRDAGAFADFAGIALVLHHHARFGRNPGNTEQAGAPLELYDPPANLFVAGFIGAPEMNLIGGELQERHGQVTFQGPGISIPISTSTLRAATSGERVVLGIRPEHANIMMHDSSEGIAATITLVEQMGSHTLAVIELNGAESASVGAPTPFRVLTSRSDELRAGDRCRVDLRQSRVHLFDAISGLSLTPH